MKNYLKAMLIAACATLSVKGFTEERLPRPRILDLLPSKYLFPMAIEPAIPKDFVLMEPSDDFETIYSLFWGPKDVLENLLQKPELDFDSLKQAIIVGEYSTSIYQTGPTSFFGEDTLKKDLKEVGVTDFTVRKLSWGEYPVLAINANFPRLKIYHAWVGLNEPTGLVYKFILVCPENNAPKPSEVNMWETFLTKTVPLSEREKFQVEGQELYEGYTIVSKAYAELKVIAERRISDNKLFIDIQPLNDFTTFSQNGMTEGRLGSQWEYGHPAVKVHGVATYSNGNLTNIIEKTITVLIKPVTEFSK